MAKLDELTGNVRIELGDKDRVVWDNDELIRAVRKTISLMSRLLPKKAMVEVTVTALNGGGTQRLDLSTALPDFIRIDQLEYPYNQIPQQLPAFNVIGTTIFLTGSDTFVTDKKARIIYLSKWAAPTIETDGDYPSHLNDAVIVGAAGQALIYKAEYYVHQAATLVGSGSTILSGLTDSVTAVTDALTSAKNAFAASLTTITLAVIGTIQDSCKTILDTVDTQLEKGDTRLNAGDDYINAPTRGNDVAALYAQYAEEEIRIGNAMVASTAGYRDLINTYVEKATRQGVAGTGYVAEATQRIALIENKLSQAERDENLSVRYLEVAGRYLASGQAKINEFLASLGYKPELPVMQIDTRQPAY